ncbi:hypothetical protein CEXT_50551 [Caerostris extrusa]|uniref:Uncharacterized protein n=1 Tax=Caerostris extrusa TaxID=172846 RepID=A0AAV4MKM9_CAEEX|nr:hypothetical protein CEXT_50551 [Caerostris extrusa]
MWDCPRVTRVSISYLQFRASPVLYRHGHRESNHFYFRYHRVEGSEDISVVYHLKKKRQKHEEAHHEVDHETNEVDLKKFRNVNEVDPQVAQKRQRVVPQEDQKRQ